MNLCAVLCVSRIVSKHGIKMKAAVAIQRKLLEMAYTLYKKQEKYNHEYLTKSEDKIAIEMQELSIKN